MHCLHQKQEGNKAAQHRIHVNKNNHRAAHRQPADDKINRRIACEAVNFAQIAGEARKQLAAFVFIVKAEGQLLQMAEQIAAHVAFHGIAHGLRPIDDAEMHAEVYQIHGQQCRRPFKEQRQILKRQLLFQHQLHYIGKEQLEQCAQQRAYHKKEQNALIRFIIAEKCFEHKAFLSSIHIYSKARTTAFADVPGVKRCRGVIYFLL